MAEMKMLSPETFIKRDQKNKVLLDKSLNTEAETRVLSAEGFDITVVQSVSTCVVSLDLTKS